MEHLAGEQANAAPHLGICALRETSPAAMQTNEKAGCQEIGEA